MADVKISALPAVTSVNPATAVLPIVEAGVTDQITAANLLKSMLPSQSGKAGKFLGTDGTSPAWLDNPQTSTVVWNYPGTPLNLFEIAIPSWAKEAEINIAGLSLGQPNPGATIQLKVGGSAVTSGYSGGWLTQGLDGAFTNCLITINASTAGTAIYGQNTVDTFGTNQWMTQGQYWRTGEASYLAQSCYIQTASMPTAFVFQAGGAGTFDAGQITVVFKG